MSKREKLIQKIKNLEPITFEEAKKVLLSFGFVERTPFARYVHKIEHTSCNACKNTKTIKVVCIKAYKGGYK